jgi:hypothetical protein
MVFVGPHPCNLASEWSCHSTTQLIRIVALLLGMPLSTADALTGAHVAQRVWGKLANSQNATLHFILVSFQPTTAHLVRVAHAHAMHPFPDNHFARKFVLRSPGGCLQPRLSVPVPVPSPEVSRLWLWVSVRFFDICNAVHSVTVLVESTDRSGPK